MKRLVLAIAIFLAALCANAQLSDDQRTTVRAFACADTGTARPLVLAGNITGLQGWLNTAGTFVVWRKAIPTMSIGPVLNYTAVANLTTANRDRATTFVALNPSTFDASQDVADYWDVTFGGTLGGQGANVRTALQAHWRRSALRVEQALATGTGTTGAPGALTYEGRLSDHDAARMLFTEAGVQLGC